MQVYTTVPPVAYLAKKIGGNYISVKSILFVGQDPEKAEPKFELNRQLKSADIYLKVGHREFGFERKWMPAILSKNGKMKVASLVSNFEGYKRENPYIWLSPAGLESMAQKVKGIFSALRPGQRDYFSLSLSKFREEVRAVEKALSLDMRYLPPRTVIVVSDSWNYLFEAFPQRAYYLEKSGAFHMNVDLADVREEIEKLEIKGYITQPGFPYQIEDFLAKKWKLNSGNIDPLEFDVLENYRKAVYEFKRVSN